jgi:hypothetical protein
MENLFKKVINPGKIKIGKMYRPIFCKIELGYNGSDLILSISGVVAPLKSGNAIGGCGQIIMEFKEYDKRGSSTLRDIKTNDDWDYPLLKQFFDIWDKWHLNDLQAGCSHQQETGQKYEIGDICPICKYKYGHGWHTKKLPEEVIKAIKNFPETKIIPNWV